MGTRNINEKIYYENYQQEKKVNNYFNHNAIQNNINNTVLSSGCLNFIEQLNHAVIDDYNKCMNLRNVYKKRRNV